MSAWRNKLASACIGIFLLAACDEQINYETSLATSTHNSRIERDALDATVQTFLGDRFADEADTDGLLGGNTELSDAPFDRRRSRTVQVRVQGRYPLRYRWFVIGDVAVFRGQGEYDLPEGVSVLTDPAAVTFTSVGVGGSVGLAYRVAYRNGFSTEISAGVGGDQARTKTSITSDLLAVSENSTSGRAHVFLGTRVNYAPSRETNTGTHIFVEGKAKRFQSGSYDATIALGVGFQR